LVTQQTPRGRILVVDDEPLKRITLQIELSEAGFEVCEAVDAATAERLFESRPIDVVVSDVRMPGLSGLDLLARFKQRRPEVEIILMTAYATVDTAVLAIKRGAYDYITKPFTTQQLIDKLETLFAARQAAPAGVSEDSFGSFLSRSPAMIRLFARLREAAETARPVLLRGERGTGKRSLAEALVAAGPRAHRPMLSVSCDGQAAESLETELFGMERGAGGATRGRPGAVEDVDGGTLLLEDVEQLPPAAQQRLLRVIEDGESTRVGGATPTRVDVRVVALTRCDVESLVRAGQFRDDLYYRLSVLTLTVPPLRERPEDIALLARQFIEKHSAAAGGRVVGLSNHAIEELVRHAWPGNVRELEHVIERALALCGGGEIKPEHIAPLTRSGEAGPPAGLELAEAGPAGLQETVADIERRMILMALRQCGGNQARAAQKLGIPRTTLRDKMAKYSIPMG
jgi:DNA-binding NtrC family response regulator